MAAVPPGSQSGVVAALPPGSQSGAVAACFVKVFLDAMGKGAPSVWHALTPLAKGVLKCELDSARERSQCGALCLCACAVGLCVCFCSLYLCIVYCPTQHDALAG